VDSVFCFNSYLSNALVCSDVSLGSCKSVLFGGACPMTNESTFRIDYFNESLTSSQIIDTACGCGRKLLNPYLGDTLERQKVALSCIFAERARIYKFALI